MRKTANNYCAGVTNLWLPSLDLLLSKAGRLTSGLTGVPPGDMRCAAIVTPCRGRKELAAGGSLPAWPELLTGFRGFLSPLGMRRFSPLRVCRGTVENL